MEGPLEDQGRVARGSMVVKVWGMKQKQAGAGGWGTPSHGPLETEDPRCERTA